MMVVWATNIFQMRKKVDKYSKDSKIGVSCKRDEKLYLIRIKQPREGTKKVEPVCCE